MARRSGQLRSGQLRSGQRRGGRAVREPGADGITRGRARRRQFPRQGIELRDGQVGQPGVLAVGGIRIGIGAEAS